MYRTRTCGNLRLADEGLVVTLAGWVQRTRKMGGMTFVDLRDRYGITQLVFNQEVDADLCEKANKLGREYVIQVTGTVRERSSKNKNIPTGDIELIVSELNVLNAAVTPPFTIEDETDGGDDLRMKYRYLDLRRNAVRKNLEKSKETMVIANLDTKHIIGIYETVNGNTRVLFFPSMVYSDIIDLNNQGCRWEGDCQEGKPCGWGRYYDESNRLSYEGFRYDKFNVCYGTYYYKDTVNEQPKYKGQMAFNYKHGYGKLYDRTGALVYDGGYFYSEQCENITVTVPDGTKQRQYHNTMMAHYAIGKMCYMERSKLELIDYPCLETLDIGGMSYSSFQMSGSMRIIDCPRLRKITISVSSFTGFNVLELKSENDDGDGR